MRLMWIMILLSIGLISVAAHHSEEHHSAQEDEPPQSDQDGGRGRGGRRGGGRRGEGREDGGRFGGGFDGGRRTRRTFRPFPFRTRPTPVPFTTNRVRPGAQGLQVSDIPIRPDPSFNFFS
ncbi:hypothetical protein PRIPAC_73949 [Pristionchus pacificus]|uniref:Uncharacterized protein n=1 Tax=Pristionchus pacificus TaxID=54126 RepID=A0A2A6C9V7_PRIPA|nr:hypothetical protein PRIPAC_73949 [Pristionchus pacificus]|eukprot:PDM74964.1 hypothetical protein PRIPAC_40345 [Pristionchus pacificus]